MRMTGITGGADGAAGSAALASDAFGALGAETPGITISVPACSRVGSEMPLASAISDYRTP